MILERLRNETRTAHQSLERLLIPRIKHTTTLQQYSALLAMFYGFYKPLEDSIDKYVDNSILPDIAKRRKAGIILNDINAINSNQLLLPISVNIPEINNHSQALGALYVLEGSTLGGQVICKILEKNLDLPDGKALDFFSGYGNDTHAMWQSFVSIVNTYTTSHGNSKDMVQAANDTFKKISNWAEQN